MTRVLKDKKELYKLVAYLVMADGGVYQSKSKTGNGTLIGNARFVMTQSEDHLDFCEYAQEILLNVTGCNIKFVDRSADTDANRKNQWRVETKNHPLFTHMRDQIYVGTYKSLSKHYLKALDWESAAILYMSDGCLHRAFRPEIGMVNPSYSISLNLKRLSYGDCLMLKHALEEKEMGAWKVKKHNQYFYLTLGSKFVNLFLKGVEPYIVPSYEYKLVERLAPTGV